MAKQSKTSMLDELMKEAQAASHEHREAQAEAQAAEDEVARCRNAAAEAHAAGGDIDAALLQYHDAERTLDEARIKIDGFARKAERARTAVTLFTQTHHLDLVGDLEPETTEVMAAYPEAIARLVELEDKRAGISARAAQYVTAGGFDSRGNMPNPDVLGEVIAVLRDVLSGVRPLEAPLPHWKHRNAMEEHYRAQAEEAERRDQDKHQRAAVGT